MKVLPLNAALSTDHFTAIGKVIVAFAFLEDQVARVIVRLTGVGPKAGRLALASGKLESRVSTVTALLVLAGIRTDEWKSITKDLSTWKGHRDALAHSIWLHDESEGLFYLQATSGNSPGNGKSRKTHPEGIPYTAADITAIADKAMEYAVAVNQFCLRLPASPDKSL
jgi:hypothetical protein